MPWMQVMDWPNFESEVECLGVTLAIYDFSSQREENHVTDTVIDAFGAIMAEFLEDQFVRAYFMSAQAFENLLFRVDSYLTSVSQSPIIFNDLWFIPAHVDRNHWILFVVIVKKKVILVLDSLNSSGKMSAGITEFTQMLRLFIDNSLQHTINYKADWNDWAIYYPTDIPLQGNCFDCGIYVFLFMFSVCKEVKLPPNVRNDIARIRQWVGHQLFAASVPTKRKQCAASAELIDDFYKEADKNIELGILKVDKPWAKYPPPNIRKGSPDKTPTTTYLPHIMQGLFKATDKHCGAPSGCHMKGKAVMTLCELCREWYHRKCIADFRVRPRKDEPYVCPQHQLDQTKTRHIQQPIRLRSL